jgi:hypothetical protein
METPDVYNIYCSNLKKHDTILISDHQYKNSGIKINNHMFPLLPIDAYGSNPNSDVQIEFKNQCTRQWIRAMYGKLYNYAPASDMILYLFLTDVLRVKLSNVSEEIKNAFIKLGLVMLDRKRFASGGVKEIDHLKTGNPPIPVLNDFKDIDGILAKCTEIMKYNISPFTLWYAIVSALNVDDLIEFQKKYCLDDLTHDGYDHNISILDWLKTKISVSIINIIQTDNQIDNYEFFDYVTYDDTSLTGGYKVPSHTFDNIQCNPKYVVSNDSYIAIQEHYGEKCPCPICGSEIHLSTFEFIKPMNAYINKQNLIINDNIQTHIFDTTLHHKLTLESFKVPSTVINMKDIDFNVPSYEISEGLYIKSKLQRYTIGIKTSDAFIEAIYRRCPFLRINFNNICVAGGCCSSILLKSPINDIDIFLVNINDNDVMRQRVNDLTNELIINLKTLYPDSDIITLYKKGNSVLELLCVETPPKEEQKEDELTRYKKCKIHQKIQIILRINNSIHELLDEFDIYPACVAFDGHDIYFNKRSELAYKYMINVIDDANNRCTPSYDQRICKYYNKGFNLLIPSIQIPENSTKNMIISDCVFKIDSIVGNKMYIDNFSVTLKDKTVNTDNAQSYKYISISSSTMKNTIEYINFINSKPDEERIYYKINDTNSIEFDSGKETGTVKIELTLIQPHKLRDTNWYDVKAQQTDIFDVDDTC